LTQILLVEPNQKIAKVISDFLLRDRGVKVNVAHSAQEAIHSADQVSPDLVILELAMPMQNGFAFLHEFRSYEDWSEVPVIIHSHLARDEAMKSKSWKLLGAKRYFYKPRTSLARLQQAVIEELAL